MEELGDARLRCDQLMRYVDEAVQLIEKSDKKDHFFEVAGHLIQGIPETAFKLEKALQAVALAADRIDYEEIKQELRPEKVEELERVLRDVRIRPVKHRSENPMKPKEAATRLREFAKITREEGSLPLYDVAAFIAALGHTRQASSSPVADTLDRIATVLESGQRVSRQQVATILYRMAGEAEVETAIRLASQPKLTQEHMQLGNAEEVKEKFKAENPDITDEALNEIAEQWSKNKNVIKDKTALDGSPGIVPHFDTIKAEALMASRAANVARWRPALLGLYNIVDEIGTVLVMLGSMDTQKSEALKREIRQQLPQAAKNVEQMGPLSVLAGDEEGVPGQTQDPDPWKVNQESSEDMALRSRFEQGVPADPTQNMDQGDGAEWKENTEEHKDKFKEAAGRWKALFPRSHSSHGHFFDLEANGASFRIEPVLGANGVHVMLAGQPMYRLLATIPEQGTIKYRRQLTDIAKLKSVAEAYAKTLDAPAGGVDFTNEWTKTAASGRTTHLEGKSGHTMCGEEAHKDTLVKSPRDATCYYCKQAWEKKHASSKEALGPDGGGTFSKFEEGKPADPTENMSPEDAKAWKEEHDNNKDNFKSAYDRRRIAADDGGFEDGVDKGKFTIILHQTGATKWTATYINPQGGSGRGSATSSAKAALQVVLGRIDFKGQKTVKVLTKKLKGEEWETVKTETVDTEAK